MSSQVISMTGSVSDQDRLFDEAIDHMIRLQNESSNPVALERAHLWRQRSSAHAAAWEEASEVFGMTGKVLGDLRKRGQGTRQLSRRNLIVGGLAFATATAIAGPDLIVRARADYITGTAEVRRISLPDGSAVTLGPQSAITFELAEQVRRVGLLRGMGYFEAADDPARPFEVLSENVVSHGQGPSFDVSLDDLFVNVGVDHGAIGVRFADAPAVRSIDLADGQWARFGGDGYSIVRGERDRTQMAAWRRGMMFADNEPISAVVAKIARWQPGRVVLANPALGRASISGGFDLGNPVAALRAVVHPYGGKVRQISRYLTIISSV